jgi:hypothetical protein
MIRLLSTLPSYCRHLVRSNPVFLLQAKAHTHHAHKHAHVNEPSRRRELIQSFVTTINAVRFDTVITSCCQEKRGGGGFRLLLSSATKRSLNHGLLVHQQHHHLPCFSSNCYSDLSSTAKISNRNFSTFSNDKDDDIDILKRKLTPEDKNMTDLLIQYKVKNGDCHIPTGTSKYARQERERLGVSDDLANWAVRQRRQYRRSNTKGDNISNSLSTRIIILESIGFMWSCRESQWQRSFNKLELYGKRNGGNLTIRIQDDLQMYTWIEQQRKAYKKGLMSIEREDLLKEIEFVFDPKDAKWWINHENLCLYHEEHGDTLVPLIDDEGNPNYLGQWVARQRRLYHNGALMDGRIKALNNIVFSWEPDAESWDRYYTQLCNFYKEHNHTRVPRSMGSLWNWVDRQRRSYRKRLRLKEHNDGTDADVGTDTTDTTSYGILITKGNIKRLSNIGFEWEDIEDDTPRKIEAEDRMKRLMNVTFELSLHDENWAENFRKISAYHKEFNHFSVPTDPVEYKELNTWVRHQRYLYNANKLRNNRVELFDSIGFAWTAESARWDRLYDECISFYEEHDHIDIPIANTELYHWTKQQRANILMDNPSDHTIAKNGKKERLDNLKEILLK